DYVVELGRGAVVDEVEMGVVGLSAGETKEIRFELADESSQTVEVTVREIKEKVLPELDDELARSASEFETLAELRADVESRTRELLRALARQVEARGVPLETYLAMTGQQPEQLVARLGEEASRSVARELVLEAVADELGLQVSDEDVEALVREQAGEAGDDVDDTLLRLRESGRFETLRDDIRLRDALDRVAGEVKRIPRELADAREAIWTPDKEKQQTE